MSIALAIVLHAAVPGCLLVARATSASWHALIAISATLPALSVLQACNDGARTHTVELVDAYALADDSTIVHQQGVLTYMLFAI